MMLGGRRDIQSVKSQSPLYAELKAPGLPPLKGNNKGLKQIHTDSPPNPMCTEYLHTTPTLSGA